MSAMFKVTGTVSREPKVLDKVAFLTVECALGNKRSMRVDVKAFDRRIMESIGKLGAGEEVEIEGDLMQEELRDGKAGPVKNSFGKSFWIIGLKATRVEAVGGGSKGDMPSEQSKSPDDDLGKIPF